MLFYLNYFFAIVKCNFIIYLHLNLIFKSSVVEDEEQETFIINWINGFDAFIYGCTRLENAGPLLL